MALWAPLGPPGTHFGAILGAPGEGSGGLQGPPGATFSIPIRQYSIFTDSAEIVSFCLDKLPAKNMKWQSAGILSQKKQTTVKKQQTAATSNKQQ